MPNPKTTDRTWNDLRNNDDIKMDQYDKPCILPKDIFEKSNEIVVIRYIEMNKKDKLIYKFPNAILINDAPDPEDIVIKPVIKVIKKDDKFIDKHSEVPNKICGNCKKDTLVEDTMKGEVVCDNCGMLVEKFFDKSPEWRNYQDDGKKDTMVRCIYKGKSNGSSYKENRMNKEGEYIQQICEKNAIIKIVSDTAKILFHKISTCTRVEKIKSGQSADEKDPKKRNVIIRGNNRLSIIAACVFFAALKCKYPLSCKKIAAMFSIEKNYITKGKKQFCKLIKISDAPDIIADIELHTPEDHISFVAKKMKLNIRQYENALTLARNCVKLRIVSDHTALSIASGCLMLLIVLDKKIRVDKKMLAVIMETSEVTITKIFNKLRPYYRVLLNDELTEHIMGVYKIVD